VAKQATDADWTSWQGLGSTETNAAPRTTPTHTVQGTLKLDGLAKGNYRIGLWLPASHRSLQGDPKYAVRVANGDVPFTSSGVNRTFPKVTSGSARKRDTVRDAN